MSKSKLTKKRADVIAAAVLQGMPKEHTAALADITANTLAEWVRKGEKDRREGKNTSHARLVHAIDHAEACRMKESLSRIQAAGKGGAKTVTTTVTKTKQGVETTVTKETVEAGDWKADSWWLERRFPEDFGRKIVRQEHTGKDGGPLSVLDIVNIADGVEE